MTNVHTMPRFLCVIFPWNIRPYSNEVSSQYLSAMKSPYRTSIKGKDGRGLERVGDMRAASMKSGVVVRMLVGLGMISSSVWAGDFRTEADRMEVLTAELSLNENQASQIMHILEVDLKLAVLYQVQHKPKRRALMEATRDRVEESNAEIEAILDGSQRALWRGEQNSGHSDRRTMELVSRLALDVAQIRELKIIMAASSLGLMRDQMGTRGSAGQRNRDQMMAMRDEMERVDGQILEILSEEQHEEYKEVLAERREEMESRRGQQRGGRGGMGGGRPGGH